MTDQDDAGTVLAEALPAVIQSGNQEARLVLDRGLRALQRRALCVAWTVQGNDGNPDGIGPIEQRIPGHVEVSAGVGAAVDGNHQWHIS